MSAPTAARWPFAPLLATAGHPPVAVLARRLRVSDRTVWRWQRHGLDDHQADRAAIALGYHPANIWPTWHHHPH